MEKPGSTEMANAEASQKDPWILRWKDPDRCRGRIVESVEPPLDVPWIFGAHHFNIYIYIHTYHFCWSKKNTPHTFKTHVFSACQRGSISQDEEPPDDEFALEDGVDFAGFLQIMQWMSDCSWADLQMRQNHHLFLSISQGNIFWTPYIFVQHGLDNGTAESPRVLGRLSR